MDLREPHFLSLFRTTFIAAMALLLGTSAVPGASISEPDDKTLIIDEAPEMNVIAFGKTVIVRRHAKEVFAWGGDIIVEGRVDGDVASLGGSVIQREGGYIGGAVIVLGGSYKPEIIQPKRGENSETVVIGMFEEEFRQMAQNPSQIFAPSLTVSFVIQRLLSGLFWFVVTLVFATLAPGAISRAIVRFQLTTLKVFAIGAAALVLTTISVIISLQVFPDYIGAVVSLMMFVLLLLAYVFGRVALQVSTGKAALKFLLPDRKHSEALAVFVGVLVWTAVLSIPYLWTLAVFVLFAAGTGLVLTARTRSEWKA